MIDREKDLLDAIKEDRVDWLRRRIIADYYEENGDLTRAEFHRWMADNHFCPFRLIIAGVKDRITWTKYAFEQASGLPPDVFDKMPIIGASNVGHGHKTYRSWEESEQAVYFGWLSRRYGDSHNNEQRMP